MRTFGSDNNGWRDYGRQPHFGFSILSKTRRGEDFGLGTGRTGVPSAFGPAFGILAASNLLD
jgi:hypothetical protein